MKLKSLFLSVFLNELASRDIYIYIIYVYIYIYYIYIYIYVMILLARVEYLHVVVTNC